MFVDHTRITRSSYTIASSYGDSDAVDDLTPGERRECDELSHHTRRRDWLAGRRAAKAAIAAHCAVSQARVRLVPQIDAAPVGLLRNDDDAWSTLPLSISISHHDGRALAAVVDAPARVGVDLALSGEIEREHHQYFLAPSEWSVAERIGATLVWALKEAAWKALSLNGATPFTALRLGIDDKGGLRGLWFDECWIPATARTWRVSHDMVAAAVCVEAELQ
jgi:4'-phosphopantetheinyl transferase EntD